MAYQIRYQEALSGASPTSDEKIQVFTAVSTGSSGHCCTGTKPIHNALLLRRQ